MKLGAVLDWQDQFAFAPRSVISALRNACLEVSSLSPSGSVRVLVRSSVEVDNRRKMHK